MDSRVHIVIALIAAFAAGEVSGIALMLRHGHRSAPSPRPRGRQHQPQGAEVIPFTRRRVSLCAAHGRPRAAAAAERP